MDAGRNISGSIASDPSAAPHLILPLFALANAGVDLHGTTFGGATARVSVAVMIALVIGKPLGVIAAGAITIWSGLSPRPNGLAFRHLLILGLVAGIGFTMSLFVAQLAFIDESLLSAAKLGVLAASVMAIALGILVGRLVLPTPAPVAPTKSGIDAPFAEGTDDGDIQN